MRKMGSNVIEIDANLKLLIKPQCERHPGGSVLERGCMGRKVSGGGWVKRDRMWEKGFCWCHTCNQYLAKDNFGRSKRERYKKKTYCKSCLKVYDYENREHIRARKNKLNRQYVSYYKRLAGGQCAICEWGQFPAGLDFHHVKPEEKEYNMTNLIKSNNDPLIRYEMDKCILLCRICHMGIECGSITAEFIKNDDLGWSIKPGSIHYPPDIQWEDVPDKILYAQMGMFNGVLK